MRAFVACVVAFAAVVSAELRTEGLTVNVGSRKVQDYAPRLVEALTGNDIDLVFFALQECTDANPDTLGDRFLGLMSDKYPHAALQPVVVQGDDMAAGQMGKTILITIVLDTTKWEVKGEPNALNIDLAFHPALFARKTADPITKSKQGVFGEANNKGAACLQLDLQHVDVEPVNHLRGPDASADPVDGKFVSLSIISTHMSFKGGTLHRARSIAAAALACSHREGAAPRTTIFAGDFNGRGAYMKPESFKTLEQVRAEVAALKAKADTTPEDRTTALMKAMGDEMEVFLNGGVPPAATAFLSAHLPAGVDPQQHFKLFKNTDNKMKFFDTSKGGEPAKLLPLNIAGADGKVFTLETFTLAELFRALQLVEPPLSQYWAPTYKRLPSYKCGDTLTSLATMLKDPAEKPEADDVVKSVGPLFKMSAKEQMWCEAPLNDATQMDLRNAFKTAGLTAGLPEDSAALLLDAAASCDRGRCYHVGDTANGKHMPAATDRILVDADMVVNTYGPVYPRGMQGDHNIVRFSGTVGQADVVGKEPEAQKPVEVGVGEEDTDASALHDVDDLPEDLPEDVGAKGGVADPTQTGEDPVESAKPMQSGDADPLSPAPVADGDRTSEDESAPLPQPPVDKEVETANPQQDGDADVPPPAPGASDSASAVGQRRQPPPPGDEDPTPEVPIRSNT